MYPAYKIMNQENLFEQNNNIYIYKFINNPAILQKLFPEIKCIEEEIKKRIVLYYYKQILEKRIKYFSFYHEKYIQYFKNYIKTHPEQIYTCTCRGISYNEFLKNPGVVNAKSASLKVVIVDNNSTVEIENIDNNNKRTPIPYSTEYGKWCYGTEIYDLVLNDHSIFSAFITQYITIGAKIQITNYSLPNYKSGLVQSDLMSETFTIINFDPNSKQIICEFNYKETSNGNFFHLNKEFIDLHYPGLHMIYFQYTLIHTNIYELPSCFKLMDVSISRYNSSQIEICLPFKETLRSIKGKDYSIDNIEFIKPYIDRLNFDQFIQQETKLFSLSSFYGTELFNIMSSYLGPK